MSAELTARPRAGATVSIPVPGPRGISAYESAVAGGFSGTEAQWIASLEGAPGGGSSGPTGFHIGTTAPTASGAYLWVEVDGSGNFIDMHTGVNP